MEGTKKVYAAISAVSAELSKGGIAKNRKNAQQGYQFRGIDDVLNALASILTANNLVILPTVLARESVERTTKSGGTLFYVTVRVRYSFVHTVDGSSHDIEMFGEAMDSADKATNKALSASYKYAAIMTFCIPTEGDNDADAVTHEVLPKQPQIDINAWYQKVVESIGAAKTTDAVDAIVKAESVTLDILHKAKPESYEKLMAGVQRKTLSLLQKNEETGNPIPKPVNPLAGG